MGIRTGLAVILGLAAWAGVLAWIHAPDAGAQLRIAALFGVNIALHLLWTPLFFNLRRPDWALIEVPFLWLSVVVLMVALAPFAPLASWLLVHTCFGSPSRPFSISPSSG